ncbi:MAG: hypothetical protein BWX45_00619 [Deltaproteobacteria bacterium ADurb.Bin002]|nr:MAG: hypothetical protein BWX45_00619 [Deltaproteobacteria bacterium ADurb.Bin002]
MKFVRNKAKCLPFLIPIKEGLTSETISGGSL